MKPTYQLKTGLFQGTVHGKIEYDKDRPGWANFCLTNDDGRVALYIPFATLDIAIGLLQKVKRSKEYKAWTKTYER